MANGAGVTATVAVDATGETIYVNTVGSFTFPGVGDTDSIMRLDAATGAPDWIRQVTPDEQFGYCTGDSSIECSTDAMCDVLGPCVEPDHEHAERDGDRQALHARATETGMRLRWPSLTVVRSFTRPTSWPQAASMSSPRVRRIVAITPPLISRSRKRSIASSVERR